MGQRAARNLKISSPRSNTAARTWPLGGWGYESSANRSKSPSNGKRKEASDPLGIFCVHVGDTDQSCLEGSVS